MNAKTTIYRGRDLLGDYIMVAKNKTKKKMIHKKLYTNEIEK